MAEKKADLRQTGREEQPEDRFLEKADRGSDNGEAERQGEERNL